MLWVLATLSVKGLLTVQPPASPASSYPEADLPRPDAPERTDTRCVRYIYGLITKGMFVFSGQLLSQTLSPAISEEADDKYLQS